MTMIMLDNLIYEFCLALYPAVSEPMLNHNKRLYQCIGSHT